MPHSDDLVLLISMRVNIIDVSMLLAQTEFSPPEFSGGKKSGGENSGGEKFLVP